MIPKPLKYKANITRNGEPNQTNPNQIHCLHKCQCTQQESKLLMKFPLFYNKFSTQYFLLKVLHTIFPPPWLPGWRRAPAGMLETRPGVGAWLRSGLWLVSLCRCWPLIGWGSLIVSSSDLVLLPALTSQNHLVIQIKIPIFYPWLANMNRRKIKLTLSPLSTPNMKQYYHCSAHDAITPGLSAARRELQIWLN